MNVCMFWKPWCTGSRSYLCPADFETPSAFLFIILFFSVSLTLTCSMPPVLSNLTFWHPLQKQQGVFLKLYTSLTLATKPFADSFMMWWSHSVSSVNCLADGIIKYFLRNVNTTVSFFTGDGYPSHLCKVNQVISFEKESLSLWLTCWQGNSQSLSRTFQGVSCLMVTALYRRMLSHRQWQSCEQTESCKWLFLPCQQLSDVLCQLDALCYFKCGSAHGLYVGGHAVSNIAKMCKHKFNTYMSVI